MEPAAQNRYYIEVLKGSEKPKWPRPEEDLIIGSQDLSDGYTQYWAYHQDSGKSSDDLPPAEVVASENPAAKPAILIDQPRPKVNDEEDDVLDLILVKDSHAWAMTSSSIKNLEENLSSLIQQARDRFSMEVEHFMTTDRVSEEVEKKLDNLEEEEMGESGGEPSAISYPSSEETTEDSESLKSSEAEEEEEQQQEKRSQESEAPLISQSAMSEPNTPVDEPVEHTTSTLDQLHQESEEESGPTFKHVATSQQLPSSGIYSGSQIKLGGGGGFINNRPTGGSGNKIWFILPILALLLAAAGVIYFRDTLLSGVSNVVSTPTPTPLPTQAPTPTPTLAPIERGEYKVRVLNGTTTSGLAKSLLDNLKDKGWGTDKAGNNTDQDIASGYVRVKADLPAGVAETLIQDLAKGYKIKDGDTLAKTDKADLEVVIGKENQ